MSATSENAAVSAAQFTVSVEEGGIELIHRLAGEWRELCADAAEDQPFYRPEWILGYLRAFAPDATLVVITARHDGRMELILPMIRENAWFAGIPVRMLRAPVNSHPGRFDVVRRIGEGGEQALFATFRRLEELSDWDLLEFPYVPESSTIAQLLRVASGRGFAISEVTLPASPFIRIPEDHEQLDKFPVNKKLRSQLRQVRRHLEEKPSLRLRRIEVLDRDALQRFYELEASGWKGREGSAILSHPNTHQFYDEIAEAAATSQYFCLYLLEWDGQVLAGHFGLAHNGRYYSPKVAYDETLKQFAPGHLIVAEILNDCAKRGIREIDITGPSDEWKMKWTADTRPNHVYFIFAKSMRGILAFNLRFKIRPVLARLLRRQRRAT